jgi:PST family polysaccharide transporter
LSISHLLKLPAPKHTNGCLHRWLAGRKDGIIKNFDETPVVDAETQPKSAAVLGGAPVDSAATDDKLAQRTASGLGWQVSASGIRFLGRFGIGIALARLLPPEDFGIVGIALIATGFASTLADLGLGPALVQAKNITQRHIRVSLTLSVLVALLMATLLYSSAGLIAGFFDDARVGPVLRLLSATFLLSGFGLTAGALLARRLAFKTTVKIELLSSIIGYGGVAIALAAAGFGYWSLVWGTIAQTALSVPLTYAAERHSLRPLISRVEIRDLLRFSSGMSLSSTVNFFARQGDYFVVGRLMSASSLGIYSRAFMLMELPHFFLGTALSRVLFPAASRVQSEPERFRRAYLTTFSLSVAVSTPVSLAVVILAPEIILTLYGGAWAAAIPLVQILSLFGMFRMSYNTAGAFVRAKGHAYRILLCQVIYGTLVVGGSWWAASLYGLEGVAWAVGGAIASLWVLIVGFANQAAGVSTTQFARALIPAAAPGVLIAAVLIVVVTGLRVLALPQPLVLVVGGGAFSILTLRALIAQARNINHPAINQLLGRFEAMVENLRVAARGALGA